jgi:hypothetical protein
MAAGTSYSRIYLTNGQVISVYYAAAQAVGTSPTVNLEGTALVTSNTDFVVKSKCAIRDIINTIGTCATKTSGQMEVYSVSRSLRTGRLIDQEVVGYAVGIVNRAIPQIGFAPGNTYRFIQTIISGDA